MVLLLILLLAGCGGNPGVSRTSPGTTRVLFTASDAAADQVLALEFDVTSLVLTSNSGATFNVVAPGSSVPIEVAHLSATAQPLAVVDVPQGTYVSGTITLANGELAFVNLTDGSIIEQNFPGPFTISLSFSPNLVVGATPLSVNFDIDMPQSVTITGTTATLIPVVLVSSEAIPADPNSQNVESGKLEDLSGTVTSVGSNSFGFQVASIAQSLTIFVDNQTEFEDVAGLSGLTPGMIVEVDAVTQTDGGLLATKVEAEIEQGVEVEQKAGGFIVGLAANQITILVHKAAGAGAPAIGSLLTVSIDTGTIFAFEDDDVDLSGLPFTPAFDSLADLAIGQEVEVETVTTFADPVQVVNLEEETIGGTATSQVLNQFVLGLDTDSAFRVLSGHSDIDFFVQPGTELKDISTIALGSRVRVRGLLFFDAASGRYELVASRVAGP